VAAQGRNIEFAFLENEFKHLANVSGESKKMGGCFGAPTQKQNTVGTTSRRRCSSCCSGMIASTRNNNKGTLLSSILVALLLV
jgi:hypothetical protein